jgi:hypothetical protein
MTRSPPYPTVIYHHPALVVQVHTTLHLLSKQRVPVDILLLLLLRLALL